MKRIMALIIGALLITLWAIPVSAEEGIYENAGDWYSECYKDLPEYVCGVWSADGTSDKLMVGVWNNKAGQAGKQELLSLIRDDESITFVNQTYSRTRLIRARDEIVEFFGFGLGLHFVGIDDENNKVVLGFDIDSVGLPETEEKIDSIMESYGNVVSVKYEPPAPGGNVIGQPFLPLFLSEGIFENAGDWYREWKDKMPGCFCGLWSTDGTSGNLTVGIQDTQEGNAWKEDVLFLIRDDSTVTFVYQTYSYAYLLEIKEYVNGFVNMCFGVKSAKIDAEENCVVVKVNKDEMREENDPFFPFLQDTYGDAILIEYERSSGVMVPTSGEDWPPPSTIDPPITQDPPVIDPPITQDPPIIDPPITQDPPNEEVPQFSRPTICVPEQGDQGEVSGTDVTIPLQTDVIAIEPAAGVCTPENHLGNAIVIITFVIVYMISMALMAIGKRKMLVMRQTDFGTTVVESYPISTGSVKKMVKSSHPQISPELDEKVFEAINAANREDMV